MSTLLYFLGLVSVLAFIHELGHFVVAKLSDIKVEEFGIGLPPRIAGLKVGETLYSVNAIPLGGFVKLLGEDSWGEECSSPRAFCNKPFWQQAAVLLAGVTMNLLLGLTLLSLVFACSGVPEVFVSLEVEEVMSQSPAEAAGLSVGRKIVSFGLVEDELQKIRRVAGFTDFLEENLGKTIYLGLEDDETEIERVNVSLTDQRSAEEGYLGIRFLARQYISYQSLPLREVPTKVVDETVRMTGAILSSLGDMFGRFFTGRSSPEGVAGPLGVAKISGRVAEMGLWAFLHFGGVLSINLAIFNVLPLPALDGGRLVLVFFERLTGKDVTPRWQVWLNAIGFIFLIVLLIWATFWDVVRFF